MEDEIGIRYRCCRNPNGRGFSSLITLPDTGTTLRLDSTGVGSRRFPDVSMRLQHPNYMTCYFFKAPNQRIHKNFKESLAEYVERLKTISGYFPLMTYSNDWDPASHIYIPDPYKLIFQGMLKFVDYLHSEGECLQDVPELDPSVHFGVDKGEVGYWCIDFEKATFTRKARDFKLVGKAIQKVIGHPINDLPADMAHLLRALNVDFP